MSAIELPLPLAQPSRNVAHELTQLTSAPATVVGNTLPAIAPQPHPEAGPDLFTEEDQEAFQRDDAMAGGMISVILSIAFCVLMSLVIGVTYWTMTAAAP